MEEALRYWAVSSDDPSGLCEGKAFVLVRYEDLRKRKRLCGFVKLSRKGKPLLEVAKASAH